MVSTPLFSSPSCRLRVLRRSAALLALGALLGAHLIAPGAALAGGCGYCDDDFDGLTNGEELDYGTNLAYWDTDYDGVSDFDELFYYSTNPLVPDQRVVGGSSSSPYYDVDGDGLSDYDEQTIYGTNPDFADTDHDGLNDGDEVIYFRTSPLAYDTDGDGVDDGSELALGFDPLNRFSRPGPKG
jgi:hypothetical protein